MTKVSAALALAAHSIDFRVGMEHDELVEYLEGTDGSRDMDRVLTGVDALIPRMAFAARDGNPNPNDGQRCAKWKVGKEASEVMYVDLAKAYLPTDFDYAALLASIRDVAHDAACSECEITETSYGLTVRFWWD